MKKIVFFILGTVLICNLSAQNYNSSNSSDFSLGNGLIINSGNDYQFKLSGMIQPTFSVAIDSLDNTDFLFNSKHTFFTFSGFSKPERVSFLMLADFSLSSPLLDAWVAYHVNNNIHISFGQKLISANNRSMLFTEDNNQFSERSILSSSYSQTGREFGLFVDLSYSIGDFNMNPSLGVSSGDGRNSFGSNSRDVDYGGFKYFGRLDFYPLGYFSDGNNLQVYDMKKEKTLKMVLGLAASYNDGASNSVGEGHGDFFLYNVNGDIQLPDYRQLYFDFLLKYRGISFLAEYVNTSASSLEQIYTDPIALSLLQPTSISEYLALGSGVNFSLGYIFSNNFGLDLAYSKISAEYEENLNSIVSSNNDLKFSLSKYFLENNLKVSTTYSRNTNSKDNSSTILSLVMQLRL